MNWTVSTPTNSNVAILTPAPQNITVCGHMAFKEVIEVNSGHIGLIQYDWCPFKERRLEHRHM